MKDDEKTRKACIYNWWAEYADTDKQLSGVTGECRKLQVVYVKSKPTHVVVVVKPIL